MTQTPETRRHRDGMIDFDFYRAQVTAARQEMLQNAFKLRASVGFLLFTLAFIVCVTVIASTPKYWATAVRKHLHHSQLQPVTQIADRRSLAEKGAYHG